MPPAKALLVNRRRRRRSAKKSTKAAAKKAVDKKQNKRIAAIEKSIAAEQGWIDSYYKETTMNRTPQIVTRGTQDTGDDTKKILYCMAQGTDGSDKDHKRIGKSIKAKQISGHIMISGRGSAAGYPPDEGDESGSNQVRLLGVVYKTLADYNAGLEQVLQYSETTNDTKPAQALLTFFKKQSQTNWDIWLDEIFAMPYTTQTKKLKFNYKVPDRHSKMVYALDTVGEPITNIFVLYAMTGVRKNDHNRMTLQAYYRCTYEK